MATYPLLLGTGLFLGLGMPLARWLAPHGVEPLAFALWPTAVAGLVLGALARVRQGRFVRMDVIRFGAIAGLVGYAVPMTLAFWLAARAGAGYAAMAFTMPPLFTLAINLLARREPWRWQRAAGIALGMAAAGMLVARAPAGDLPNLLSVLAVFAIPLLIGAANVYRSAHLPDGVPAAALGSATLIGASAILLAMALATHRAGVPLTPEALAGMGAQAGALVAGYLFYFELQQRADPVLFSFMGYVIMLTGVLVGMLALGEPARWTVLPALALLLAALRMVAR